MNGFRKGGGRIIVCQGESEAERHEWEKERDEKKTKCMRDKEKGEKGGGALMK